MPPPRGRGRGRGGPGRGRGGSSRPPSRNVPGPPPSQSEYRPPPPPPVQRSVPRPEPVRQEQRRSIHVPTEKPEVPVTLSPKAQRLAEKAEAERLAEEKARAEGKGVKRIPDYGGRSGRGKGFQCKCKIFTLIYLIAIAEGVGIIVMYFMVSVPKGLGATFVSVEARDKLLVSAVFAASLGLAGYIILNKELRSIILGIVYLFMVIWALFTSLYALSRSLHVTGKENFNHIVNYSKFKWQNSSIDSRSIPVFVETFQANFNCCGWGEFYWTAWPRELNTTDLPPSCCAAEEGVYHKNPDCGKALVPRRPSGFLSILSANQYQKLTLYDGSTSIPATNRQRQLQEKITALFQRLRISNRTIPAVPPPWLLREVDEELAYDYYKKDWKDRYSNQSHRFRFEEIRIRIYPIKYEQGYEEKPDIATRVVLYTTQGLEELQRIQKYIRPKPCAPAKCRDPVNQRYERCVNPSDKANDAMMVELRKLMIFVQFFAIGLMATFIVMALVHWYYFSILKTREIAENDELPEFQKLDTKPVVPIDEVLKGDVNEESIAKMQIAQQKRKERREQFAMEKARLKSQHEEAVKRAADDKVKKRLAEELKGTAKHVHTHKKQGPDYRPSMASIASHIPDEQQQQQQVELNTALIIAQEASSATRDYLKKDDKDRRDDDERNNNL